MLRWVVAGIGLCVVSGCREAGPRSAGIVATSPVPAAAEEHGWLRDEARLVLEAQCGLCHIGAYESARPGALRVFDLVEADWAARMTEEQLRSAIERLRVPRGESAAAGPVSESDRAIFARFVDREIARRGRTSQIHLSDPAGSPMP